MLCILWLCSQEGGRNCKLQVLAGGWTFAWQLIDTKPHSLFLWGGLSMESGGEAPLECLSTAAQEDFYKNRMLFHTGTNGAERNFH